MTEISRETSEAEFFEAAVSDVLYILVHIVSIEAEYSLREKVAVIRRLESNTFDHDIANLCHGFSLARSP